MSLVTVAGYAAVLYVLAKLLTYLSKYVRSPLDVNKLGEWSLVTGATDGIGGLIMRTHYNLFGIFVESAGKGLCEELARRGQNVVLVSRTVSKLQQCAQELETKYKVKTKIIDIDFSSEANIQQRIEADTQVGRYMMSYVKYEPLDTQGLSIGLLINNVGMSYDHPEYFLEIEDGAAKCQALIDLNINSMLKVTRAVLPSMVAR